MSRRLQYKADLLWKPLQAINRPLNLLTNHKFLLGRQCVRVFLTSVVVKFAFPFSPFAVTEGTLRCELFESTLNNVSLIWVLRFHQNYRTPVEFTIGKKPFPMHKPLYGSYFSLRVVCASSTNGNKRNWIYAVGDPAITSLSLLKLCNTCL